MLRRQARSPGAAPTFRPRATYFRSQHRSPTPGLSVAAALRCRSLRPARVGEKVTVARGVRASAWGSAAADAWPLARGPAARCEHQPAGGGDLPRPRRAGGGEDEAVALEQHERRGHELRPAVPWSGAGGGDPASDDGLPVTLVLSVAEGGEDNALLSGHDRSTLATGAEARNRPSAGRAPASASIDAAVRPSDQHGGSSVGWLDLATAQAGEAQCLGPCPRLLLCQAKRGICDF